MLILTRHFTKTSAPTILDRTIAATRAIMMTVALRVEADVATITAAGGMTTMIDAMEAGIMTGDMTIGGIEILILFSLSKTELKQDYG